MSPIATYSLRRLGSHVTYELFSDRVQVRARQTLNNDYDVPVLLGTLIPESTRVRVRRIWLIAGVLFAAFFWGSMTYAIIGLGFEARGWLFWMLGLLGLCGALVAFGDRHKKEFVTFTSDAGVARLSFLVEPKKASELESFLEVLRKQIKIARETKA